MRRKILFIAWVFSLIALIALGGVAFADESSLGLLNLNGVTYYVPALKSVAIGTGVEFAQLKDGIIGIRGEAVATRGSDTENKTLFGIGVGVNIPKLIAKAGGQWIASVFNPSINAAVLADFGNSGVKPYFAIGINVIQIPLK